MSEAASETIALKTSPAEPPVLKKAAAAGERLMSVDALRGFDMFWIIGAEWIVSALKKVSDAGVLGFISGQLEHKQWEGLHFYDMIFPLFVFIAGVSTVFSLSKALEQGGRNA